MITEISLLILFIILIYKYFGNSSNSAKYSYPPGPKSYPFLGSLIEFVKENEKAPFKLLRKFSKKYGSLMHIQVGQSSQIVFDDYESIKEVLCNDIWVERFYDNYWAERSNGKILGILFVSGEVWKEMRRFALRTLRDFGFGRQKSMEEILREELLEVFEKINNSMEANNGVVKMDKFFTVSILNVLWSMMAGNRFSYDDKRCQELVYLMDNMSKHNPIGLNIYQAFPILWYLIPRVTKARRGRVELLKKIKKFFREIMEERRKEGSFLEDQRDFIDVFLKEIDNAKKNPHLPNSKFYTDDQFIIVCLDLFGAGSETSSNSLEFALLYSILYPETQKKVQEEIDRVVGRSRFPNALDKQNMPYTEAAIAEVQRLANVVPMIIRSPTEDTQIGKYFIPKDTIGVFNMYSMHMNKEVWADPESFRPERFLDEKTGKVINTHLIIPFGLGKRVCLGEPMARTTLFTYYTSILQNYNVSLVPNKPKPSTEAALGFTLSPQPYEILFKLRK